MFKIELFPNNCPYNLNFTTRKKYTLCKNIIGNKLQRLSFCRFYNIIICLTRLILFYYSDLGNDNFYLISIDKFTV